MNNQQKGWCAAIFIGLLWGTPWILGIPILDVINSNLLVWLQYTMGCVTLGAILLLAKFLNKDDFKQGISFRWKYRRDIFWTLICGCIGQGLFSLFSFLSLDGISASENGVIQGLIPILILVFGAIRHNIKFTKIQILSAPCAFLGVAILIMDPTSPTQGLNIYHFICLLGAICFASNAYVREYLAHRYGAIRSLFFQFFWVSISFSVLLKYNGENFSGISLILSSPLRLFCISIIGIGISGLSYLLYLYAIRRIGVDNAAMALNCIPLSSFILAVMFLGESVTLARIIAISLVMLSIYLFMKHSCTYHESELHTQNRS